MVMNSNLPEMYLLIIALVLFVGLLSQYIYERAPWASRLEKYTYIVSRYSAIALVTVVFSGVAVAIYSLAG